MNKASIVISTYNMGFHIHKTIESILNQSEKKFEVIIIDDCSTDNTKTILKSFNDKRIKLLFNRKNLGKALSRNKGIKAAKSKYIFFTDGDCIVSKNWLSEGLKTFNRTDCAGVEGRIYFVSKQYKSSYSDRVVQNLTGGEYMTANIAYRKDILNKSGLFNAKFKRNQDRDLAIRVKRLGVIIFNPKMITFHMKSKWTPKNFITSANWVYYRVVLLFKIHNEKYNIKWRIYAPKKLLTIFFPPLLLSKLLTEVFKSRKDVFLLFFLYPRIVYERYTVWKSSIREKVFII